MMLLHDISLLENRILTSVIKDLTDVESTEIESNNVNIDFTKPMLT